MTVVLTSLLCTLVKLNFAGLKGWEILFIVWGCLLLLNLISFNYKYKRITNYTKIKEHSIRVNGLIQSEKFTLNIGIILES